jgi:hypothetical protein
VIGDTEDRGISQQRTPAEQFGPYTSRLTVDYPSCAIGEREWCRMVVH